MTGRLARDMAPVVRAFAAGRGRRLLLGAGLSALTALAGIALLGLSGWFITATALAGLTAATALSFGVLMPAAAIRLLAVLRTVARYGERVVTHGATLEALAALRVRLFRGWSPAEAAGVLARRPSRLLFRIAGDTEALDAVYLRLFVPVVTAFVAILAVALTLGVVAPWLGMGALVLLLLAGAGVPLAALRRAGPPALARARRIEALRARTVDLVRGQADLTMTGGLPAAVAQVARVDAALAVADDRVNRAEVAAGLGFGVAGAALIGGVTLAAGALVARDAIGVPVAALAILVAVAAPDPFAALRRAAPDFVRARLAARRIGPRLQSAPAPEPLRAPGPELAARLRDASAGPVGAPATIRGVSLDVREGERIAITGPSGVGKSTLLLTLAGEIRARAGVVAARPSTLVTQRSELFADSLRDNLRIARPEAEDRELTAALEAAGLALPPGGLDAVLGEGGLGLSGGQARRVTLARLFLRRAPLWLLDEPTEGVDATTARDIAARLDLHQGDCTIVVVTHVRREAEAADRIILMERGKIAAIHSRGSADYAAALTALRPD